MIAIASDHAGYELKEKIKQYLTQTGRAYQDYGTDSTQSCHYPVYAKALCRAITDGTCDRGILICGTGIGMSMAAACSETYSAKYTRLHNDANVLCIGARVLGEGLAEEIVEIFLSTDFEGGKHQTRIDMLED